VLRMFVVFIEEVWLPRFGISRDLVYLVTLVAL
jgi:hypothetical protein